MLINSELPSNSEKRQVPFQGAKKMKLTLMAVLVDNHADINPNHGPAPWPGAALAYRRTKPTPAGPNPTRGATARALLRYWGLGLESIPTFSTKCPVPPRAASRVPPRAASCSLVPSRTAGAHVAIHPLAIPAVRSARTPAGTASSMWSGIRISPSCDRRGCSS